MKYEQTTIDRAMAMLDSKISEPEVTADNPRVVTDYLRLKYTGKKNEVFGVMFLDNSHNLIEFEFLFYGTINASSVHPRVVVQRALEHNAAAVILVHNHPSGRAEASIADIDITKTLKKILAVVDVRVLDHIIIAGKETVSLSERGQL